MPRRLFEPPGGMDPLEPIQGAGLLDQLRLAFKLRSKARWALAGTIQPTYPIQINDPFYTTSGGMRYWMVRCTLPALAGNVSYLVVKGVATLTAVDGFSIAAAAIQSYNLVTNRNNLLSVAQSVVRRDQLTTDDGSTQYASVISQAAQAVTCPGPILERINLLAGTTYQHPSLGIMLRPNDELAICTSVVNQALECAFWGRESDG